MSCLIESTAFCLSGNFEASSLIICHCDDAGFESIAMNAGAEAGTMLLAPEPTCAVVPPHPAANNAVTARTPAMRRIALMFCPIGPETELLDPYSAVGTLPIKLASSESRL